MKDKKQVWQAVKFTLFSVSAGIIQIGSFALLEIFIKDYWIPYLISLVLSILWNFTLNRRYTFKSVTNVPVAMAKVFGFYQNAVTEKKKMPKTILNRWFSAC